MPTEINSFDDVEKLRKFLTELNARRERLTLAEAEQLIPLVAKAIKGAHLLATDLMLAGSGAVSRTDLNLPAKLNEAIHLTPAAAWVKDHFLAECAPRLADWQSGLLDRQRPGKE